MAKDYGERLDILEENSKETLQILTELKLSLLGSEKLRLKGALDYVHNHEERLEEIKVKGIVSKVEKHQKYIENEKKKRYIFTGSISTITFAAGAFGDQILEAIKKLFK